MKLLTQEVKTKLQPLYSQEDKGGKAIAHVKFFTPDSSWTWWATYVEHGISRLMWSSGLCRVISQSRSAVVFSLILITATRHNPDVTLFPLIKDYSRR
jgi:hypothetical protein